MYKHKNNGTGIITVVDDNDKHHVFEPGQIITLNRIYKEIEVYGIKYIPEKKSIENKVPIVKKSKHKSLGGD